MIETKGLFRILNCIAPRSHFPDFGKGGPVHLIDWVGTLLFINTKNTYYPYSDFHISLGSLQNPMTSERKTPQVVKGRDMWCRFVVSEAERMNSLFWARLPHRSCIIHGWGACVVFQPLSLWSGFEKIFTFFMTKYIVIIGNYNRRIKILISPNVGICRRAHCFII